MTMLCSQCDQYGILWMGPWGALTHTECPHCGGINCQYPEDHQTDDDAQEQS